MEASESIWAKTNDSQFNKNLSFTFSFTAILDLSGEK